MADLASRYASLMEQMAKLYEESNAIAEQLRHVIVTAESWDRGRGGGHLQFTVPPDVTPVEAELIEAWARDSDNWPIQIIWHFVEGKLNWGEWIKVTFTGGPIEEWPPTEISAAPPTYSANDVANLTDDVEAE